MRKFFFAKKRRNFLAKLFLRIDTEAQFSTLSLAPQKINGRNFFANLGVAALAPEPRSTAEGSNPGPLALKSETLPLELPPLPKKS